MSKIKMLHPRLKDDEETLNSPCFEISKNVELKEVPTTGEEFLLKVINERRTISAITRCKIDISKYKNNQSCFVEEVPVASAPDKLKPTVEWQNIQVADFSDVRMYISRMLAKKDQWSDKIEKVQIEDDSLIGWKDFFHKKEPKLSCVLGLHATMLDRGLIMLVKVLKETVPGLTINHKTGQWIYAFLACLKQPLLSDTISIIRDLARQCAKIRSKINADSEDAEKRAAPLNIFICLVAKYFRQHDLAD